MLKRFLIFFLACMVFSGCQKKQNNGITLVPLNDCKDAGEDFDSATAGPLEIKKIDVDLSMLNFNIASAQIFNMLIETDLYLGKTVRIKGQFFSTYDEDNKVRHYSVLIWDATACCQTGLQFILRGEHEYPADYPEEMCEIEITGTLCIKDFNGMDYIYLDVESL